MRLQASNREGPHRTSDRRANRCLTAANRAGDPLTPVPELDGQDSAPKTLRAVGKSANYRRAALRDYRSPAESSLRSNTEATER